MAGPPAAGVLCGKSSAYRQSDWVLEYVSAYVCVIERERERERESRGRGRRETERKP